jgi:GR25 family glycosyltransferase involved in LPS biosynthesis
MNAVDGRHLSQHQTDQYVPNLLKPRYPFALRDAEIATFLSHRNCWQAIVDSGVDAALILEDDVTLDQVAFASAFEVACRYMNKGDFIRFPIKQREAAAEILSAKSEPHLTRPKEIGLGMVLQLVTREAAQTLLDKTAKFDRPVDTYLQMHWAHRQCRFLSIWPSGVREISHDLGGSLIGQKKSLRERLYREIMRPVYRRRLQKQIKLEAGNEKNT